MMSISISILLQTVQSDTLSKIAEKTDSLNTQVISPDNLSEMTEKLETLGAQVEAQQFFIYILFGILAIFLLAAFFLVKRFVALQYETDKKQNDRLVKIENHFNVKVKENNGDLISLNEEFQALKKKLEKITVVSQVHSARPESIYPSSALSQKPESNPYQQRSTVSEAYTNVASSTPVNIIKYFSLQEGQGNSLSVLERHLVDDSSMAWFKMNITGNTATFEINQNAVRNILADIPQLHRYALPFDSVQNPSRVETVRVGQMRKDGKNWIVTEKITVKLT